MIQYMVMNLESKQYDTEFVNSFFEFDGLGFSQALALCGRAARSLMLFIIQNSGIHDFTSLIDFHLDVYLCARCFIYIQTNFGRAAFRVMAGARTGTRSIATRTGITETESIATATAGSVASAIALSAAVTAAEERALINGSVVRIGSSRCRTAVGFGWFAACGSRASAGACCLLRILRRRIVGSFATALLVVPSAPMAVPEIFRLKFYHHGMLWRRWGILIGESAENHKDQQQCHYEHGCTCRNQFMFITFFHGMDFNYPIVLPRPPCRSAVAGFPMNRSIG